MVSVKKQAAREPGEYKTSCKENDQIVGERSRGLLSCHAWVLYEGADQGIEEMWV